MIGQSHRRTVYYYHSYQFFALRILIMQQTQKIHPTQQNTHDEMILVVPTATLFRNGSWQGIRTNSIDEYINCITTHQDYQPRSLMEQDARFKQIIPYMIFKYNDTYFVMQRRASASEKRLANKYTLGIGGHIRQEDMMGSQSLFEWAKREFHEEVTYTNEMNIRTIGLINDDSNPVGQVHLGVVLLLEGTSDSISVKSELKNGTLLSLQECKPLYHTMESWSQYVLDFLQTTGL